MKKPKFVIESEKVKELLKRLKPIENWSDIKAGQLIFHNSDNNINNVNKFSEYNKKDNVVWYHINDNGKFLLYNMSATGWYIYDECIADEVEEEFTPKLWWSHKHGYDCDMWFIVCCNAEELRQRYIEEFKNEISMKDFEENYDYGIIDEVDDYKINVE